MEIFDYLKAKGFVHMIGNPMKAEHSGSDMTIEGLIEGFVKENNPQTFEEASRPLIKYIAENHHPHTTSIVDSTHAELFEGKELVRTEEYLNTNHGTNRQTKN